jgi:predicted Zn-dependent protease
MEFWLMFVKERVFGAHLKAFRGGGLPVGGGSRRTGSGCNPRIVMAFLMIGGAIAMHYLGTTKHENEFTGRVQRLALATEQEEVAMGLQAAPQMIREMGGEHPDRRARELVDAVGAKLIQTTAVKETRYPFDFHLLADDQTVNAFALPGGQIFITSALLKRLKTEDQLAGVLGHEIGHVVGRHSNEQMAQQGLWSGVARGVGLLLSDGESMGGGMQVADMLAQVRLKSYGRDDELESDKLGLRFMAQAGYDPNALIGVMEILAEASGGGGGPEFLSTHPSPQNRIEKIKEEIARLKSTRSP